MFRVKESLLTFAVLAHCVAGLPASDMYNALTTTANVINLNVSASSETYTVQSGDTIASIAKIYDVGACDMARLSILADVRSIYVGEVLRIPERATFPDDVSCFSPNNTETTNTCINGGPHTYETQEGDTLQKIANINFNITIESIVNETAQTSYIVDAGGNPYAVLEAGQNVKIPVCANSACTLSEFSLSYGTFQDFANQYSVTVGQLFAINSGYNHSEAGAPVLSLLHDCAVVA